MKSHVRSWLLAVVLGAEKVKGEVGNFDCVFRVRVEQDGSG